MLLRFHLNIIGTGALYLVIELESVGDIDTIEGFEIDEHQVHIQLRL